MCRPGVTGVPVGGRLRSGRMEDDTTRTPRPRAKSARPPAALFVEPQVPPARPAPEPEPEPAPKANGTEPDPPVERQPAKTAPRKVAKRAAKKAEPEPPKPAPRKRTTRPAPQARPPWWSRTPLTPAAVPELLAEAAVERFGDSADRYVHWLRATYPQATPDGLARLAIQRLARRTRYTALAGAAGPVALLATRAELVLHVAAAYGRDPRDPARVPELLAVLDLEALAGPTIARLAGRLLPGAGLVAGVLTDAGALERTGRRAVAYYRATD